MSAIIAKPFGKSKYDWYKAKSHIALKSKMGRRYTIEKGDKFGVRDATSKAGMKRVIVDELGKTIIFSMPNGVANRLLKKAVEIRANAIIADDKEHKLNFNISQLKHIVNAFKLTLVGMIVDHKLTYSSVRRISYDFFDNLVIDTNLESKLNLIKNSFLRSFRKDMQEAEGNRNKTPR